MTSRATSPATRPPTAVVTGGSQGLGLALVSALLEHGWQVVTDARDRARLRAAVAALPDPSRVTAIPGDVRDPEHRLRLARAAAGVGGVDLLVHNASTLGPTPLPPLAELDLAALAGILAVNTLAPLALTQLLLPSLTERRGRMISISSDAAVEAYPGWGGYGASKAALDQLTAVLAAEHPELAVYSVDPGDMRTEMARHVFPATAWEERADPASVVPALLRLVAGSLPSGRYAAAELVAAVPA